MSHSQSIQTCDHCQNQYISGDSIEFRCGSCRRRGHHLDYNKCRICAGKEPEGKDSLANIDQIISTMPKRRG